MTVFQIVSNEVLAKVLKVEEFSPVKAMSLDVCHLIHMYTWKTVSIPNGSCVSSALTGKQEWLDGLQNIFNLCKTSISNIRNEQN